MLRKRQLIGDLTDVTSLAAGKLAVTTAPNDGMVLVAEALATFRLLAAEKRISLEVEVAGAPLLVVCDRGRILQVLANLLGIPSSSRLTGARSLRVSRALEPRFAFPSWTRVRASRRTSSKLFSNGSGKPGR